MLKISIFDSHFVANITQYGTSYVTFEPLKSSSMKDSQSSTALTAIEHVADIRTELETQALQV